MRPLPFFGAALLALGLLASAPAPAGGWGPTVYTTPDDVTPFRRSDDPRLFRDRDDRFERAPARRLEHGIRREADRLQSRARAQPEGPILQRPTRRDLEVTRQELRSLQARDPAARALPQLELQLDRVERELDEVERRLEVLRPLPRILE